MHKWCWIVARTPDRACGSISVWSLLHNCLLFSEESSETNTTAWHLHGQQMCAADLQSWTDIVSRKNLMLIALPAYYVLYIFPITSCTGNGQISLVHISRRCMKHCQLKSSCCATTRQEMTGSDIRQKMVYSLQFQLTCAPVMLSRIEAETISTFLQTESRLHSVFLAESDSVFATQTFRVQVLKHVYFN